MAEGILGSRCPYCSGPLAVAKLSCKGCGLGLEGRFSMPRLARLSKEEQRFVELFVLASGSLKQTASSLGVSYPTVRNRLDALIEGLKDEQARDEEQRRRIMDDIEAGRIPPKQGLRMLDEL